VPDIRSEEVDEVPLVMSITITLSIFCLGFVAIPAYGYVDPNATGLISQILTPLLIAAASATFLRKRVGAVLAALRKRLRRGADV
jgi:hypothetical protein